MEYLYNKDPSEQKRTATLRFKRAELLYDASNYAYVEADILPEDAEHSKHQVFDITQEGNVDRVTRVLNLTISECVEALYPYAKYEIPDSGAELDDILTNPEEYVIKLSLPETFSMTTVQLLENLIHELLVCRVLADWLSITLPQSADRWRMKAEEAKGKLQTSLVSRLKGIRRKLKPW